VALLATLLLQHLLQVLDFVRHLLDRQVLLRTVVVVVVIVVVVVVVSSLLGGRSRWAVRVVSQVSVAEAGLGMTGDARTGHFGASHNASGAPVLLLMVVQASLAPSFSRGVHT
jgi:hypothetical protein